MRNEGLSVAVAGLLATTAMPALAQTATPSPPAEPPAEPAATEAEAHTEQETPFNNNEIVVTARKREERLQNVPASVTAFNADQLRELGIRDITDLSLQTPGFAMQNASRQNEQPFIRGMAVNSVFRQAQNASFFVDGIYVSGVGRTIGLEDVERVEVILGPQAVYFGRATFAGAINYVSRKPRLGRSGAHFQSTIGESGLFDISGGFDIPIGDRFAMRLYLQSHDYRGDYRNSLDGRRLGTEDTKGMSFSVRWKPFDALDLIGRVQRTSLNDGHSAVTVYNPLTNNNCLRNNTTMRFQFYCGELRNPQESDIALNLSALVGGGYRDVKQKRYSLLSGLSLGEWQLSALTALNREDTGLSSDGDATRFAPQGGLLQSLFVSDIKDFQQELRLTSPQDRPLRFMVGASHFASTRIDNSLVAPIISLSNPRKIRNDGVYASASWTFVPTLTLTAEGRYQRDRIKVENTVLESSTNAFLPRVTLDWKPTRDLLLFATVAKGNKPSDFNTAAGTPVDNRVVEEETIRNHEVGIKSQWFNRRLTANATGYWIDWDNQAYQDTVLQRDAAGNLILAPNGQPRTVVVTLNTGKSRVRGLELDGQFVIVPGWSARMAYSYTNAEYRDFLTRLSLTYQTTPLQVRGNSLQNTPKHKIILSTTFDRPLGSSGLNLFGSTDYTIRGRQFTDELNTAYVGRLNLWNARLGISGKNWQLFAYGRNLTNSKIPDFATRSLDFNTFVNSYLFTLRPRRTFGLTASNTF